MKRLLFVFIWCSQLRAFETLLSLVTKKVVDNLENRMPNALVDTQQLSPDLLHKVLEEIERRRGFCNKEILVRKNLVAQLENEISNT